MKIYKLKMETENPSENKYGFFTTLEKAQEEIKKWTEIVEKDIKENPENKHYCVDIKSLHFDLTEIPVDEGID